MGVRLLRFHFALLEFLEIFDKGRPNHYSAKHLQKSGLHFEKPSVSFKAIVVVIKKVEERSAIWKKC